MLIVCGYDDSTSHVTSKWFYFTCNHWCFPTKASNWSRWSTSSRTIRTFLQHSLLWIIFEPSETLLVLKSFKQRIFERIFSCKFSRLFDCSLTSWRQMAPSKWVDIRWKTALAMVVLPTPLIPQIPRKCTPSNSAMHLLSELENQCRLGFFLQLLRFFPI